MARVPNTPCSKCGKLCWPSKKQPQTCHECRRVGRPSCANHETWTLGCAPCLTTSERARSRRRFGRPDVYHYTCLACGSDFSRTPKRGQIPKWCSEPCGNAIRRDRRRARETAAFVADVNRAAVFNRDGWICQLCRKLVPKTAAWPHPQAAVLDHIVPLAAGGTHQPANVQCAHNLCNTVKGHRASNDQLRLIG